MKFLVAGLGNPGMEYEHTRHNIGFDVLDRYANSHELSWSPGRHGKICQTTIRGRKLLLLKPETYMNVSGKALKYWMDAEKIPLQNILVITDDLALPVAKLRLKLKGSDGGHNGLKSISEWLQTTEYPRMRFGIGNDYPQGRQVDYVLGKWQKSEEEIVAEAVERAATAIDMYVFEGPGNTMTKINAG
jgi:peptidyl-tRNA hydrolase, PTH1 family